MFKEVNEPTLSLIKLDKLNLKKFYLTIQDFPDKIKTEPNFNY